jgi:hypothetical protein
MTRNELAAKASQRGYSLDASVTDERLAHLHPHMMNGRPTRLTRQVVRHLDVPQQTANEWIIAGHYLASYDLGMPGDEIIAPPTTDSDLMVVSLPSYWVVAVCGGRGEATDGENTQACEMNYTILRKS